MTSTGNPEGSSTDLVAAVTIPAAVAREALDLIILTVLMLPALRARAQQGTLTPASLDQLITMLTGGRQDGTAGLTARLEAAQRELAAVMLARETGLPGEEAP
jgi:hypothetical protein